MSQPLVANGRLDPVAIAPVVLGKLHVIIEDQQVDDFVEVEISAPRHVIGLDDPDFQYLARIISATREL